MINSKKGNIDIEDPNKLNSTKTLLHKGIKYLVISLPLLFISPILITIGFKAIQKSNSYFFLILGCILAISTIVLVVQGFRVILKYMFEK